MLLAVAFILLNLTACNMNPLPRNMNLQAFDPHRADFVCKHEVDVNPPITAESEALFQQGMAVTSYELLPKQRDHAKAAELWKQAAALGHWKAAMNLAGLYESGQGVPEDTEQAVLIVEGLMKQGVPAAFDKMGTYHQRGIGVNDDTSRAYAFWQLAADMGSPAAQAYLGSKLKATYDNPGQGFWGNRDVALKMLECSFAQGNGDAAYTLALTITGDNRSLGEDNARALKIYHDGVKLGSEKCASSLFVKFDRTTPLTGNTIDTARSDRYGELAQALELNPDLRFPNLDKVLPLPPAELPMWDGKRKTLVDAAIALVALPAVKPTPGSQSSGRAHIPQGHALKAQPHPVVVEATSSVPHSGYWLPRLHAIYREHERAWDNAQVPQRYAKGEVFETMDRRSMGAYANTATRTVWQFLGDAVAVVQSSHPRVTQGIARTTRVPEESLRCKGMLSCPRTGVWAGQVAKDHPLARLYNRWDRFAYVEKGQSFPNPEDQHIAIAPHEVRWLWLDNANQIGPSRRTEVSLSDLHGAQDPLKT
ncbi:sel1 repeat family protein [Variovorax sp. PAMC28562]|uniref:SEL1-like repeat protein n=1 Tax=Variovorax sp. PAMC28562 TaxID=2762323 RepID=UPI0021C47299|nr:sel1 repeat family protein [Variovorax sp. PAMC28562]